VEENLLGHLLKANDLDGERAAEQHLADDPAAAADLAVLRAALRPLEADRADFDPPADLWLRTLDRVAEHVVATEGPVGPAVGARTEELLRRAAAVSELPPAPARPPIRPAQPASEAGLPPARRWNVIAVVGLSLSVLALALPAIVHLRARAHQLACEDTMLQFYQAAAGYSDTNDGQFPRVPDGQPAAIAAEALKRAGYLSADVRFACPSAPPDATTPVALVNYAYTLGFRDESGQLRALDRGPGNELRPILADAPARPDGVAVPINHRRGQNVLFADGHVRFYTVSTAGPDGDDIFCNQAGQVAAGLFKNDTVLGRPEERP
jgi:prepilin-type processing-associated H-X9-DG protein